jgi:hypothetical protein
MRLRTEPCTICNKTLALGIQPEQLEPDITGLDLFLDLHGIDDEPSHVRLLYLDSKGFVRTITNLTKFTTLFQ